MAEERSRIDGERVAKEQRERAEAAERESRVRIRLEEEALRDARERDRLLEEERRRREEQARLDGIRTAELERVRNEVARKAAVESAAAEREHALKLASIRGAANARTTRMALVGTSVAAAVAFGMLGWLEFRVHPERLAALEAEQGSRIGSERARAVRAEALLGISETKRRELERSLEARQALPVTPPPAPTIRTPSSRAPTRQPGTRPGVRSTPCNEFDPLDPCLKR